METELFALRRSSKRPATADEIKTTCSFYKQGDDERGKTGVLFIHGFTVTPANFREFAQDLAADGYTVSVPLLPGHAGRPEDLLGVRWQEWLDDSFHEIPRDHDSARVLDAIREGIAGAV